MQKEQQQMRIKQLLLLLGLFGFYIIWLGLLLFRFNVRFQNLAKHNVMSLVDYSPLVCLTVFHFQWYRGRWNWVVGTQKTETPLIWGILQARRHLSSTGNLIPNRYAPLRWRSTYVSPLTNEQVENKRILMFHLTAKASKLRRKELGPTGAL